MILKRGDLCRTVGTFSRLTRNEKGIQLHTKDFSKERVRLIRGTVVEILSDATDSDNLDGYFAWIPALKTYAIFLGEQLKKL